MKALHQRLTTLDQQGVTYELDYLTIKTNGFVYRHASVVHHDDSSLIIVQQEGLIETIISVSDISTVRIVTL